MSKRKYHDAFPVSKEEEDDDSSTIENTKEQELNCHTDLQTG